MKVPEPIFVLDAITLRGVGSYLHGARLDIKPLTVLCGANGSGKSTWLKALDLLSESLAAKRLPFGFVTQDWDHTNIQVTNAFCHLEDPAQLATLEDAAATAAYGTMGTIGLQFHATEDTHLHIWNELAVLGVMNGQASSEFFRSGTIQSNDRFRLRLAHPTNRDDSADTPTLRHIVELQYNDHHIIRMEGERDPFQAYVEQFTRPRRTKPYTLSCSRSFLTGNDADAGEFIPLAIFHDLIAPRLELQMDLADEKLIVAFFNQFEALVLTLLTVVLGDFFYIGAIRLPTTALSLNASVGPHQARYVGTSGENAWSIAAGFQTAPMRTIRNTYFTASELHIVTMRLFAMLEPELRKFTEEEKLHLGDLSNSLKLQYLYSCLPEGAREKIEVLAASPDFGDAVGLANQLLADALNELLNDPDLLDDDLWTEADQEYEGDDPDMAFRILDEDIAYLGSRVLPPDDVRRLNYLLVVDAFDFPTSSECSFQRYLTSWLKRLVEVGLNPPISISSGWRTSDSVFGRISRPTPYLRFFKWAVPPGANLARLDHPCFGGGYKGTLQVPRQMSSGFHQLFPILVQLGVMKSGELIGIENPEVHLHPALQVSMTEALLDHAVSGRRMIVETHSDLLLRRVIRAILSEEISQSQVQIYFTKLVPIAREGAGAEFSESTLEPIRTDSRGRISNWPEGFLDADVGESKQLMDIMYGGNDHEEPDDVTG